MDKKWIVRILCGILAAIMLLGIIPFGVFAEEASGTPDGTPPVLKSLTLSKTSVTAPGTIEVIAEATDDVSGVSSMEVIFVCQETGKIIWTNLSKTYYDETVWEQVEYADGKLHGVLKIDQYVESGVFEIDTIWVYDVAGNNKCYDLYTTTASENRAPLPDFAKKLQFTVKDSGTPDGTPPALKSLTLSKTSVTAPGTIEVIAEATDDVSGVSSMEVIFVCQETGKIIWTNLSKTYYDETVWEQVEYADGKLHGKLEIDQYVETGVFEIDTIWVYDVAGNNKCYDLYTTTASENRAPLPDFAKKLQFSVTKGEKPDSNPPALKTLSVSKISVKAPGIVEVVAEATDDVSGVSSMEVVFVCQETGKSIWTNLSKTYYDETTWKEVAYADGKLHGVLKIDQYVESGVFKVDYIYATDVAGNIICYDSYSNTASKDRAPLPDFAKKLQFRVLNDVADVVTSISKDSFVAELNDASNDAYISADYSGNATLPQEAFEAIAGTDKTLDLISEGVTWRFQGSDIVNDTKPIDLGVTITPVAEDSSEPGKDILEEVENKNAYVMKFGENGVLPGKATVQIKVDYAMRQYLGSDNDLCIYYYNNKTGELELVAKDLMVIGDTYVEFEISHCSYYVLSKDLNLDKMIRLAGADRFATAFKVADRMKQNLGGNKFDTIIVASGADFADALSGSYLAAVKDAPILLSYKDKQNKQVQEYIKNNLASGGTVYILGGPKAVPESMEKGLAGLNVKRLAGENRFETNLKILQEAGVPAGEEILVCTGTNFADCLSGSATGKPIMLVYKKLMDSQVNYLPTLSGNSFCIIGGENAVNGDIASAIGAYGTTTRLAGAHRYETSVMVAKKYFENPENAVLAYAKNYPDGLCGGALAGTVDAPLILTDSKYFSYAAEYAKSIKNGVVLGGTGLISDGAVRTIFGLNADALIPNK